jgi:predicted urease superfamily metal-dependent hydrolase
MTTTASDPRLYGRFIAAAGDIEIAVTIQDFSVLVIETDLVDDPGTGSAAILEVSDLPRLLEILNKINEERNIRDRTPGAGQTSFPV